MTMASTSSRSTVARTEDWIALGTGIALLAAGLSRRATTGACLAASAAPFLYRGVSGRWPDIVSHGLGADSTKAALGGSRGVHVREAIRLEKPVGEVYRFWRQLDQLPRFMLHLERVTETGEGKSHWVAKGPGDVPIEWDAEIVNEREDSLLAWQSLPGSDVVSAGSVTFSPVRQGRSTEVRVHLRYSPPAGRTGAWIAALFGREPSQTIREDLRRFKQLLEAGEIARATPPGA
ncbi:MAG: SRPBCC family protein [Vicinamibacterales bacterium]